MENVHEYAWGAVTLAYLYRQLGQASKYGVKQMAGYMTLLEAWIYEHFPTLLRPPVDVSFQFCNHRPLSSRWAPTGQSGPSLDRLLAFREHLDILKPNEVNWNPYGDIRNFYKLKDVTYFHGCIVCGDIVEPYMADRVLRQYGYVQTIPERPLASSSLRGGNSSRSTKDVWGALADYFDTWDTHLLSQDRLGRPAILPWECDDEYMPWFIRNSHVRVVNPANTGNRRRGPTLADTAPWERIKIVRNMITPLLDRWATGDTPSATEAMQAIASVHRILQGPSEAGSSTRGGRGRGRN